MYKGKLTARNTYEIIVYNSFAHTKLQNFQWTRAKYPWDTNGDSSNWYHWSNSGINRIHWFLFSFQDGSVFTFFTPWYYNWIQSLCAGFSLIKLHFVALLFRYLESLRALKWSKPHYLKENSIQINTNRNGKLSLLTMTYKLEKAPSLVLSEYR